MASSSNKKQQPPLDTEAEYTHKSLRGAGERLRIIKTIIEGPHETWVKVEILTGDRTGNCIPVNLNALEKYEL